MAGGWAGVVGMAGWVPAGAKASRLRGRAARGFKVSGTPGLELFYTSLPPGRRATPIRDLSAKGFVE